MTRTARHRRPRRLAGLALSALVVIGAALAAAPALAQDVSGSGSTFVQPLLNRWSQDHLREQWTAESQPSGSLDYEAVGSEAGVMRIKDRAVDFGATEVPLSPDEVRRYGVAQFPVVIGGVVAAVNLPGVPAGALKLTGETLAGVYLGKITRWNDPAIKALNPEIALPDADIVAVRRSDGSGTTFAFTSFLAQANEAWKPVGAGLFVAWPTGVAARGNGGVAEAAKRTANAIGYVDLATGRRAGLSAASLRNGAGAFVAPSPESFQAAAVKADWRAENDFGVSLLNAASDVAYPIVTTTFVIVPNAKPASSRTGAVIDFFNRGLERGGAEATALGYVPMPPEVVEKLRGYWRDKLGLTPTLDPRAG